MTAATAEDRADALEARCRKVMARIPAAHWGTRAERRDELEYLDRLLDEHNALKVAVELK